MIDETLVSMLATAHLCLKARTDGSATSIQAAAVMLEIDAADVSRILPLAFLSPEITQAILTGRQPIDLTLRKLTCMFDLPILRS